MCHSIDPSIVLEPSLFCSLPCEIPYGVGFEAAFPAECWMLSINPIHSERKFWNSLQVGLSRNCDTPITTYSTKVLYMRALQHTNQADVQYVVTH